MPRVNPKILVWARETAGLSRQDAAGKLGFRDTAKRTAENRLASLEAGEDEPSKSVLTKMASQYRRPLLTFYLSKPPAQGDRGADFRTLPADRPDRDEAVLDALVRDIRSRQSMVRAVLEDDEEAERVIFIGSHAIEDGREAVQASLQALLGVPQESYWGQPSPTSAFNLLRQGAERAGIFVILKGDLGNYHTVLGTETFRGLSVADPIAPFVVINDQDARPAWSFTLLHETTHLLLGQTGIGNSQADSNEEKFCDKVAGDYLLPVEELDELSLETPDREAVTLGINRFANRYNLSRRMVVYRASEEGLIDQKTHDELADVYRTEWRTEREHARSQQREREGGPNFYTVRRHRLGDKSTGLVREAMAADTLSRSKAARILGIKSRQVQPLVNAGGSL